MGPYDVTHGVVSVRSAWDDAVMLVPGTTAPPFTLPNQNGRPVSLADQAGRWVLLWWYPKAATPG